MRTKLMSLLAVLALYAVPSFAQYQLPQGYELMHRNAGRFNASVYGLYTSKIVTGNGATGASSIVVMAPNALPDGYLLPLQAAFNIATPFYIQDAAAEIPTVITAVTYGVCPSGTAGIIGQNCATINATFASLHGAGAIITSGTAGLMEGVSDAWLQGGGIVTIGREFYFPTLNALPTGTTLVNPFGLSNVYVEDVRGGAVSYWSPQPGLTPITIPTILNTASTLLTATTGGSIATGAAVRVCVEAVDVFGGETGCSTDTGTAIVTTGAGALNTITVTAAGVPAGTGIVGYRVYASAAAGASLSETLVAAVNMTYTVAPQCPLANCVMPGTAIVMTTLPAATNAGPNVGATGAAVSAAHTTTAVRQGHVAPLMLPFQNVSPAGGFAVTATSPATPGYEMGEMAYPAGFFNSQGQTYRICGGGVATATAATVAGQWNIAIGPRVNSLGYAVTTQQIAVSFLQIASMNWTAGGVQNFSFCTDVTTVTPGTSGTLEGHASFFGVQTASAGVTAAAFSTDHGVAVSSAIDLTQQGVISLMYFESASTWTSPQLRYFSITPVN